MIGWILSILIGITVFVGLFSIRIIPQYEKGVRFRLGKYKDNLDAGLNFVIPIIDEVENVDLRQQTFELRPQHVMTKDQVNLKIDGAIFFKITEPEKTILNVQDLQEQLEIKATAELKEIISNKTMSESLIKREDIARTLLAKMEKAVNDEENKTIKSEKKDWGVHIISVQINNIELPTELIRAMSKQAEAEREREARVTKARGEEEASEILKKASERYGSNPAMIKLRELQTFQEIGVENNTLMIVIPETMANSNGNWVIPLGEKELQKKNEK